MSKWTDFLSLIATSTEEVSLVGPLYGAAHQPVMPTIYVDGGSQFRDDGGWKSQDQPAPSPYPLVSVGDGDSSPGRLDELLPQDKDYSDLAFALRSLPDGVSIVHLYGFLGGRRDHELANLGVINEFLLGRSRFTRVYLHPNGNTGSIVGFTGGRLALDIRGPFSVFVLELASVTIEGACRFHLKNPTILKPASSHGLSNEGYGMVGISSSRPCFVFFDLLI